MNQLSSLGLGLCITGLLLVGAVASYAQCTPQVESSFLFGFLDEQTVVLYNTSEEGYAGYEWQVTGGELLRRDSGIAVFALSGAVAEACLILKDGFGCAAQYCKTIYAGAEGDLCEKSDCVWPGDANGDRKANMYDLLHIGLGYGAEGPGRSGFPVPGDPTAWAPNYGEDWEQWMAGINYKHFDCDGNGVVDENDIQAIRRNYLPELSDVSTPEEGATPVYLRLETDELSIIRGEPVEIFAELFIGTEGNPVEDLHGFALDIDYPGDSLMPDTVLVEYLNDSFLGSESDILSVQKDLRAFDHSGVDLAFSRKDRQGVRGWGKVARLSFVVNSDIIGGLESPELPFELILRRLRLISADGEDIPFDLPNPRVRLLLLQDLLSNDNRPAWDRQVRLFPNPARESFVIELDQLQGRHYELLSATGQLLKLDALNGDRQTIPVNSLPPGLYFLRIHTEKGLTSRRVIVER